MKKVYKSSVSKWTYLMFVFIILVMIFPVLFGGISVEDFRDTELLIYFGVASLIIGLFLWIYFGTYYKIENGYLYHRSGPFFGKMKISSIQKIKYHSGWYVPVVYKPSTDTIGLIIVYNKFDDIYISPKDRDLLVEDLLQKNAEIEIIK